MILLTTPDDALAPVAAGARSNSAGKLAAEKSFCTRVARSIAASWLRSRASVHPQVRFIRCRRSPGAEAPELEGRDFRGRRRSAARRAAKRIARSLGGVPVAIDARDKPAYHAAGALVAGHALALVEAATQILTRIGFPRRRALQTLLPLTRQMLDNFESSVRAAAWTGPIARGDYAIVAKHVKALRRISAEFQQAYAALARLGGRVLSKNPSATTAAARSAR